MHAVLEYTYEDNYLETRENYRSVHLKAAWAAVERGELLLGGAVGDGPFTGLLIFTGENALESARAFAAADPYVINGVVTSWTARPWTTVVGQEAAAPVRP
ncbi:YciI-like protein [Arthrobacter sp. MPF02]|uniref:YciI-like protein n=1 Tax=Arthrobacter sp. MPF02 TaxID=3388492 RepID=UPI0039849F22